MNSIFLLKKWVDVPGNWNELTAPQLHKILKVLYTPEIRSDKALLQLFKIITGLNWWQLYRTINWQQLKKKEPEALPNQTLATAANMHDAIIAITEFVLTSNTLTINLLPKIKNYYGPADHLGNYTIAEVAFSENYYLQYKQTNEVKWLNLLCAVLYRPAKEKYNMELNVDGDVRILFNPNLTEKLAAKWAKINLLTKLSVLHYYEGCRLEKIENNPKIFEESSGDGETLYGLWSIMRSISKSGHFGDFDKVQLQYWDTILMELNEIIDEADKIKMEQNRVTAN